MRFCQLDAITELIPGQRIVATKHLTGQEDYLRDHFPLFPVMPGVLMLEALFQASCWLVRATRNQSESFLKLKEARNVKFADFLQPGQTLTVVSEIIKIEGNIVTVKASGQKETTITVSGRLVIECSNLADANPELSSVDSYIRQTMRRDLARMSVAN